MSKGTLLHSDTMILIPAYKPSQALVILTSELMQNGYPVLVVNDGSPSGYESVFSSVSEYADVTAYENNMGKGHALKHGLQTVMKNYKSVRFVVTADADGQHSVEDIIKICRAVRSGGGLVIGSRDFKGNVPLRSSVGNHLSRFVFAIASGRLIYDNQSGLRGFTRQHIQWMMNVRGNNYDYEINVLMYAAKRKMAIREIPIRTIYEDNNKQSHFLPVRDTLRIYRRIFSAAGDSLYSLLVNLLMSIGLFPLFSLIHIPPEVTIMITTLVSSIFMLFYERAILDLPYPTRMINTPRTAFVILYRLAARMIILTILTRAAGINAFISFLLSVIILVPIEYLIKLVFALIKRRKLSAS